MAPKNCGWVEGDILEVRKRKMCVTAKAFSRARIHALIPSPSPHSIAPDPGLQSGSNFTTQEIFWGLPRDNKEKIGRTFMQYKTTKQVFLALLFLPPCPVSNTHKPSYWLSTVNEEEHLCGYVWEEYMRCSHNHHPSKKLRFTIIFIPCWVGGVEEYVMYIYIGNSI